MIQINNKYLVFQTSIYTNYNGEKSILIVSDYNGIEFYN